MAVSKQCGVLISADETDVAFQGACLVGAVDACHIPYVAATACHHSTLARITAYKARLIPCSGKLSKEILYGLWLRKETLGTVCQVLQSTLEEYRQR